MDRRAQHEFLQQAQAAIEISPQLTSNGAIIERLGELAPRNFAFRDQDKAAHAAARRVRGQGRRGIAGGGASDPSIAGMVGERRSHSHASVFERSCRIHALMLCEEVWHSGDAGALRHLVERSVPFAQRDDMPVIECGKKFAEAPDAAEIRGSGGKTPLLPRRFQILGPDAGSS